MKSTRHQAAPRSAIAARHSGQKQSPFPAAIAPTGGKVSHQHRGEIPMPHANVFPQLPQALVGGLEHRIISAWHRWAVRHSILRFLASSAWSQAAMSSGVRQHPVHQSRLESSVHTPMHGDGTGSGLRFLDIEIQYQVGIALKHVPHCHLQLRCEQRTSKGEAMVFAALAAGIDCLVRE